MTVVIAGGSGFLGRKLAKRLESSGHRVLTLTRRPSTRPTEITWAPDGSPGALPAQLHGVDAVVNLAGENIADKRWTESRKRVLHDSRLLSTRTLVAAIKASGVPAFISGSAIGYYGPLGDEAVTESTPPGADFLARVCVEWEQEARTAESTSTRVAIFRTGLALDTDGGALGTMLKPFRLGLGATLGSGRQFMPWIHADDWTALVSWLVESKHAGVFNATAPTPVTNREFTKTLGRVLRRPAFFWAPAFLLQVGMGEMSTMVLNGQRVLPAAAEQLGFRFTYRTLEPALRSLNL